MLANTKEHEKTKKCLRLVVQGHIRDSIGLIMVRFDETKQEENLRVLRAKEEEDLAEILSHKYGVDYVNLIKQPIETEALRMVDEEDAKRANAVAFAISGKRLGLATTTPNDPETSSVIKDLEKRGFRVTVYMSSKSGLKRAFEFYKDISFSKKTRAGVLDISEDNIAQYQASVSNLADAYQVITESLKTDSPYRITMMIEAIIASALAIKASDIHVEATEDGARLRFRLDGILSESLDFNRATYLQLLSRLKLLSRVKLNVKTAQDGRFTITISNKDIEVRTSILPGEDGDSVVMRILDPDSIRVSLESLGMHPTILEVMEREIRRPNGMILNTGPTGSGKTTTLYSFLQEVNSPDVKIITIEDPVEYQIEGLVQTHVSKGGLSFASGLRSIMRQDPDVILVGEIRDSETASIAIQAALTGHLVFSTLHTNTAAGTFPRLIDLEADPKTLGAALNVAMAQRLVRVLCKNCSKQINLNEEQKVIVESILSDLPSNIERPQTDFHYEAVGCDECNGKGYRGRVGVFDVVLVNDKIIDLLHREGSPSERDILEVSREQGLISIKQDAILKILTGRTSFAEVRRVIDL